MARENLLSQRGARPGKADHKQRLRFMLPQRRSGQQGEPLAGEETLKVAKKLLGLLPLIADPKCPMGLLGGSAGSEGLVEPAELVEGVRPPQTMGRSLGRVGVGLLPHVVENRQGLLILLLAAEHIGPHHGNFQHAGAEPVRLIEQFRGTVVLPVKLSRVGLGHGEADILGFNPAGLFKEACGLCVAALCRKIEC